jgi:hypothetical protein
MKELDLTLTPGMHAFVDDDQYEDLKKFAWRAVKLRNTHYASRRSGDDTIFMHRTIMSPPADMVIDHINGNGLDNRRENLRVVTVKENCQNRHHSKCPKGVNTSDLP